MKRLLIAAIAALSLLVASQATAQKIKPIYVLGKAAYNSLIDQIVDLQKQINDLKGQLKGKSPGTYGYKTIIMRIAEINDELAALNKRVAAKATPAPKKEATGFWFHIRARAGGAITGAETKSFIPIQLQFLTRYVSNHFWGVQAGVATGVWGTETVAPFMLTFSASILMEGEHFTAYLGMEGGYLGSTIEGDAGWLWGGVKTGVEAHFGAFVFGVELLIPTHSPRVTRTSELMLLGLIGGRF